MAFTRSKSPASVNPETTADALKSTAKVPPTSEQMEAARQALEWFAAFRPGRSAPHFSIAGLAGTGKTTLLAGMHAAIVAQGFRVGVCALAGKAASVIRRKGIKTAQTIHRTIYTPVENAFGGTTFMKRPSLDLDLLAVDEGSMVNDVIHNDLTSYGRPIIYFGDHGQLKPIGKDPEIMSKPDVALKTIHRQAAGNPIIQFAHALRRGAMAPRAFKEAIREAAAAAGTKVGDVKGSSPLQVFDDAEAMFEHLHEVEQIICGFHRTRRTINEMCRRNEGIDDDDVSVGDKVLCTANNYAHGIFNGNVGHVRKVHRIAGKKAVVDIDLSDVGDDESPTRCNVPILLAPYIEDRDATDDERRMNRGSADDLNAPTFWCKAWAISCHRAQGSQYKSVAVFEQTVSDWIPQCWRYTAATRPSDRLLYCYGAI